MRLSEIYENRDEFSRWLDDGEEIPGYNNDWPMPKELPVVDVRISDRRQVNALKWYLRGKGVDVRYLELEPGLPFEIEGIPFRINPVE